jgi:DNA-binding XRE family transcriptional regulator
VDQTLETERGGVVVKVDGAKLAAARERVFMSQDELAESIGMNPVVVIRLETADRRIEPWETQGDISNEPERNDGECNYT